MGDPVTAGVVGSVVAPELGAAVAAPTISSLAGAGALANPFTAALASGAGGTSPWSIGSVLNGYGTNLLAGGDPVKGLAMNASALAGSGGGSSILGSETLGGIWKDIGAASNWMKENPTTSRIGFELAQNMISPNKPIPMAPPGQVSRSQIQPMDYASLLNPQNQTVIRPATPSLI